MDCAKNTFCKECSVILLAAVVGGPLVLFRKPVVIL